MSHPVLITKINNNSEYYILLAEGTALSYCTLSGNSNTYNFRPYIFTKRHFTQDVDNIYLEVNGEKVIISKTLEKNFVYKTKNFNAKNYGFANPLFAIVKDNYIYHYKKLDLNTYTIWGSSSIRTSILSNLDHSNKSNFSEYESTYFSNLYYLSLLNRDTKIQNKAKHSSDLNVVKKFYTSFILKSYSSIFKNAKNLIAQINIKKKAKVAKKIKKNCIDMYGKEVDLQVDFSYIDQIKNNKIPVSKTTTEAYRTAYNQTRTDLLNTIHNVKQNISDFLNWVKITKKLKNIVKKFEIRKRRLSINVEDKKLPRFIFKSKLADITYKRQLSSFKFRNKYGVSKFVKISLKPITIINEIRFIETLNSDNISNYQLNPNLIELFIANNINYANTIYIENLDDEIPYMLNWFNINNGIVPSVDKMIGFNNYEVTITNQKNLVDFFNVDNTELNPGINGIHKESHLKFLFNEILNTPILNYLKIDSLNNNSILYTNFYRYAFNKKFKQKNKSIGDGLTWEYILPKN